MSRPHDTYDLSFAKHPTKPFTYIPGRGKADRILAWLAILLGTAILGYAVLIIATGL